MSEQEVVDLMMSSRTRKEWDTNCDAVKKTCGGYPEFWFAAIIRSGVLALTMSGFEA